MFRARVLAFVLGLTTVAAAAVARADAWEIVDQKSGPCACVVAAPAGLRVGKLGAGASAVNAKNRETLFTLVAKPATQPAPAHVAEVVDKSHVSDCGDTPAPPTEVAGWMCGSGGGCNGQWNFTVCGKLVPHPAGGQQIYEAMYSSPGGIGGDSAIKAMVTALDQVVGLNAKHGGTIGTGRKGASDGARAANVRGMKAYGQKDWNAAAGEFTQAITLDGELAVAHYNLACVESLRGNLAAAEKELEWLAASANPDAKKRLAKAKTDPDLQLVREKSERARELLR